MKRAKPPMRRLRWLLLVLVFGVVGALVALYLFGRAGTEGRGPRPVSDGEVTAGEGVVTLGEGFQYTHYEEGREAFSIRADKTLEDRQAQVFLEGVGLVLTDADDRRWEMEADRATYERETQEAVLTGNVRLEGADGLVLETDSLEMGNRGNTVSSTGTRVELLWKGRYRARGERLRIHIPSGMFLLGGNVKVVSEPEVSPPLTMTADRVSLQRPRQQVQAVGDVKLKWGDDLLNAQGVAIHLDPTLAVVKFIRLRDKVAGRRVEQAGGGDGDGPPRSTVTEVKSKGLVAVMKPDGQEIDELQIEGTPQAPALLIHRPPGAQPYTLRAGYMTSKNEPDGGRRVVAYGGVQVVQPVPGSEGRRMVSDRVRAEIDRAGTLRKVWAEGGVDFRDGPLSATGRRMTWDVLEDSGEIFATDAQGAPGGGGGAGGQGAAKVRLVSDRGTLEAPRVRYSQGSSVLEAEGGVEAVLADAGRLATGPLGSGGGSAGGEAPVRVEAREGQFREEPQGFLFRGKVKAWQGDRFLFAEWLRGEQSEGRLTAGGGVRTVWTGAPAEDPTSASGGAEPQTLEVEAQELTYSEAQSRLIYQGEVISVQEERSLACSRLEVTLGESGDAERLDCSGAARLDDRRHGQKAQAERAVYSPAARTVELTGSPAVVTRDDGGRIAAPRLDYDIDAGRVRGRPERSDNEEATETTVSEQPTTEGEDR